MMTYSLEAWECFGASVQGVLHKKENRPNEDAWEKRKTRLTQTVVVSDGMGSKSNARLGAKMACKAVNDSLKNWAKAPDAPSVYLLRLIHLNWGLRVLPHAEKDSATTCLFATVLASGRLVLGQLGDGIVALREPDGTVTRLDTVKEGFGNETTGLGVTRSTKEWSIMTRSRPSPRTAILLASDGIADDLKRDRIGEFIQVLLDEFAPLSPKKRYQALASELRQWTTENHLDDKTLALLWHHGNE
jgi:serine/threonine protein phosphatase PrpC